MYQSPDVLTAADSAGYSGLVKHWRLLMLGGSGGQDGSELCITASLVRHLLLRLGPGVYLAVGCGKRGEAAPKAERARNPAHHHNRGAAGGPPPGDAAPVDLARYTGRTGWLPRLPANRPSGRDQTSCGRPLGFFLLPRSNRSPHLGGSLV